METTESQPTLVTKMLESIGASEYIHRFKFGGVVGKMTIIGLIGLVVVGVIGRNLTSTWPVLGAIVLASGLVVFIIRTISRFADKHPTLALFEGAELLRWEEMRIGAKGIEAPKQTDPVPENKSLPAQTGTEPREGQ